MAIVKFIQAQKFSLAGSGASIGDTTITLQSFTQIDGTLLTTTDLGIKAFGTMEPGNGTQEEQISFTGVTQNANGTATLTGVKSVGFVSPYTETSGLAKTHAGATTFILSNDAGFYGQILSYVDTALSSGAVPATTLVNGIVTLSVAPASAAQPVVVGTNDPRLIASNSALYISSIVNTGIPFAVASGTPSALTVTLASSLSTLSSGSYINILTPSTVASGVTLNVNGLGAKTIRKTFSSSLATGDIVAGEISSLVYDGATFQLENPSPRIPFTNVYATGSTWVKPSGLKYVVVEVVGGGGGANAGDTSIAGVGGGGGGYSKKTILTSTLASSETVTVGGGGGFGSGAGSGVAGGTSSFGSHASATGGAGGDVTAGGAGGIGSSGDINIGGGAGTGAASNLASGGAGGSSVLGGGGFGNNSAGSNGLSYGGGGGGGRNNNGGGNGAAGAVIVTEYYS